MPPSQLPFLAPEITDPKSQCAGAFAIICNENWQITWVSPEFSELTGYAAADVCGLVPNDLLHGPQTDMHAINRLRECVVHKKPYSGPMLNYRKDGSTFWVHLSFNPVFNARHEFQHFVAVRTINTYMEFIEEQTQAYVSRLERQRHVLIREVHHRIKNSLQGVAGMLRQHAHAAPLAAPILEKAISQVRTIAVVHGLEGKALYNEVVLCEMVPSIARMVQELVLPHGVEFEVIVNVPERIRVCEQERVPIALILNELILNAAKHLSCSCRVDKLTISVEWQANLECARTTITNPGSLPEGFDFENETATGVGLALVKSMLPAHGATVNFVNTNGYVETRLTLSPPVIYSVKQRN